MSQMELPVGKIAEDLITELEEEINVRRREIEQFKGSIEGIKHFVFILKKRAEDITAPTGSSPSPTIQTNYRHPSSGSELQAASRTDSK